MDTTITALKNLYTALGGTASEVADLVTIPDMINAIAGLSSIKASGALSIDTNGRLTIEAENGMKIEAGDDSDIRVDGALSINAQLGDLDLNTSADMYLNTGGSAQLNGKDIATTD